MSKVITDKELEKYTGNMFTATNVLQRNTAYLIEQTVNKGQIVLKCSKGGITKQSTLNLSGVAVGDELVDGTVKWVVSSITGYGGGGGSTISNWGSNAEYDVGDLVIYQGFLYKCNTANNDSTFTESKWNAISRDGVTDWASNTEYAKDQLVMYNGELYICLVNHTSGADLLNDETRIPFYVSFDDDEVYEHQLQFKIAK